MSLKSKIAITRAELMLALEHKTMVSRQIAQGNNDPSILEEWFAADDSVMALKNTLGELKLQLERAQHADLVGR